MALSVHWMPGPNDEQAGDRLRALLDSEIRITFGSGPPEPADYQILIAGRPRSVDLEASPVLTTLIVPWAGLPGPTRDLLARYPHVAVHNLHYNADPVAEVAIALLLAVAKKIIPMDRALRKSDWRPRYEPNRTLLLRDRTALVLGYGAVGRSVGRLCQGLGMAVLYTRRQGGDGARQVAADDRVFGPDALHELLPRADALMVCLPQTPDTDGLIGAPELALMPADAVLVNVGRGDIVQEAALYQALRAGQLYGAGLDVWYNYPTEASDRAETPPAEHPFHDLDNVVMSPHRAGGSASSEALRVADLAGLLNAAARGGPLPNRVNVEAGY